ncbi:DEAD/DEAH box helicase [Nakamurella sp. DB0629]|uniref:RNA helicase n=1 Tax=Nakamurella aerolata TaxID=1656892 RepID=A0A849A5S2_9ACTN|nr:DEAD/DEAH box helicase [Nakamurella aerolata]
MNSDNAAAGPGFAELGLPARLLTAIERLGFTTPTAIQALTIPALLAGRDVAGVAQTGTGKTAAFGLPLLAGIDPAQHGVQALVLCPTRELAMQVADALTAFASGMPGVTVVSVYGGAPFYPQKQALARGAQVVVGTPGRLIDHLNRGSLDLSGLRLLVLDEADEMLAMGFADEVEQILSAAPAQRQTALLSATMPPAIRRVADTHLTDPVDVTVRAATRTTGTVEQQYLVLPFREKTDVLLRLLHLRKDADQAAIVFVRAKSACEQLTSALAADGLRAASLNGDVPQAERERIVQRLREGSIDVLVATDVAARGLDVERIALVVNFDAPRDPETYVHRIGRTGRAGRTGTALTFFTPAERNRVRTIERATGAKLTAIQPPTPGDLVAARSAAALTAAATRAGALRMDEFTLRAERFAADSGLSTTELAAALLAMAAGDDGAPLPEPTRRPQHTGSVGSVREPRNRADRRAGERRTRPERTGPRGADRRSTGPRWRIAVGRKHGVRPAGIVGAIAGEGGLSGRDLGRIDIFDSYSLVEIMPSLNAATVGRIGAATINGQRLRLRRERER